MRPVRPVSARTLRGMGSAIVVFGSLLLSIAPARAGIGIPKKVKDTANQAVQKSTPQPEASGNDQVVFDDVVLELTGDRIERVVEAFQAAGTAAAGRAALVEKLNKAGQERSEYLEKHEAEIAQVRNARGEVETCLNDHYHEARDQKMQEYAQRALTDPALREKYTKVAAQYNQAAMSGDSTAIAKAREAMYEEVLPSAADSARIQAECGPVPPPTPAEKKLESMDGQIESLNNQIRDMDNAVAENQAKETQMNPQQFGMTLERIEAWYWWKKSKSSDKPKSPRGYTPEELKALEDHLQQIEKTLG
jgi:hypothetical protein